MIAQVCCRSFPTFLHLNHFITLVSPFDTANARWQLFFNVTNPVQRVHFFSGFFSSWVSPQNRSPCGVPVAMWPVMSRNNYKWCRRWLKLRAKNQMRTEKDHLSNLDGDPLWYWEMDLTFVGDPFWWDVGIQTVFFGWIQWIYCLHQYSHIFILHLYYHSFIHGLTVSCSALLELRVVRGGCPKICKWRMQSHSDHVS